MTSSEEGKSVVRSRLWFAIVAATFVLSYMLGYVVSAKTGVEPGFFERPEAGGYGVTAEAAAPGLDKDLQNYYKNLTEE